MRTRKKSRSESSGAGLTYLRIAIILLVLLSQVALIVLLIRWMSQNAAVLYGLLTIVSLVTVLIMVDGHDSSSFRLAWVAFLLISPIFGLLLYWVWGRVDFNRRERGAIAETTKKMTAVLPEDAAVWEDMETQYPESLPAARLLRDSGYAPYEGTAARYFPDGEPFFDALLADIDRAQKWIFIQYFIVARGQLWDRVHAALLRKIRQGVEVRILYDDVGCLFRLPENYDRQLRDEGFRAAVFNPAHRFVSNLYLNYRSHQKIVVIDGQTAYTGGLNLADEYVNIDSRLGHWKDVGVRLEGNAVRGLTAIFLQMWNIAAHGEDADYRPYLTERAVLGEGVYQPYADGPANQTNPALDLFYLAAGEARRYLWMTTPYLVIDRELMDAFCRAARSGVDVRIVTPAKVDHFYVGVVNRHNYRHLLKNGVKIYEYTPGFIHAKLTVWDDRCATVGTVNLDFRSLFLHYENGVYTVGSPLVGDIREDIRQTMAKSHPVTQEDLKKQPVFQKLLGPLFNLFSPLM